MNTQTIPYRQLWIYSLEFLSDFFHFLTKLCILLREISRYGSLKFCFSINNFDIFQILVRFSAFKQGKREFDNTSGLHSEIWGCLLRYIPKFVVGMISYNKWYNLKHIYKRTSFKKELEFFTSYKTFVTRKN